MEGKNDDLAKIFRLVNDGAASVSIDDCVNATKDIANVLMDPGYASRINFTAALDVLDEHPDFWKVAFQDELLTRTRQYSFVNEVVRQWPDEDRKVFQSNLSELNERIQGKVADANVLLSSLLLGKSVTSSLIAKDRSQGDPRWLENSILDEARDIRHLRDPLSSLSIVVDGLLERTGKDATEEFWKAREKQGYFHAPQRTRARHSESDNSFSR